METLNATLTLTLRGGNATIRELSAIGATVSTSATTELLKLGEGASTFLLSVTFLGHTADLVRPDSSVWTIATHRSLTYM